MNRSWNYHHRVGGADSLSSAGDPEIKKNAMSAACKAGRHKWMTRKWTRTCLRCGTEQAKDALGRFE